jgi:drug/metabolite transporter (DMT)-like permease
MLAAVPRSTRAGPLRDGSKFESAWRRGIGELGVISSTPTYGSKWRRDPVLPKVGSRRQSQNRPTEWANLFRTAKPRLQIVRAIAPLFVGASMVMAVRYLPLAEATVVLFAAPFLVVTLSGPFLGERVSLASWIGVVIGFAAVVVVAQPGVSELSRFAIFPLAGAVFYALFQLLTGRLAAAGETADTTLAWTLGVGVAVTTPIVSDTAWLLMIVLGLSFGLAQAFLVRAFSHAPASLLAPFSYGQIIAATIFGIVVFAAVPDLWTWVGITMIVGAGVYVTRSREA